MMTVSMRLTPTVIKFMRVVAYAVLAFLGVPSVFAAEGTPPSGEWSLERALSHALEHNLELQAANKKVEIAGAEWVQAKAFPFNPEIDAELADDSRYANEGEKDVRLGFTQEMEIFGQRWSRKAAAKYRWEAAQADYGRAEKRLGAEVRQSFTNLLYLQKRAETLRAVAEFDKEVWESARKRFSDGMIRQINLDLSRVEYNHARTELLRTETDLLAERLRMNRLLGLADPLADLSLKGELTFPILALPVHRAVQLALEHRGDYLAAQWEAKAARKDMSLARREIFPNPKLGLFYERQRGTIGPLADDDKLMGVSLGFPLPLLNRNQGRRARARAVGDLADFSQRTAELDVQTETVVAYGNLKAAEELLDLYADMEDRLDMDLSLVRNAYVQGRIPIEDYLTQKDHFLQAKLDFLDTYRNYSEARATLEKATGLSWEELQSSAKGEKK